jgi:hypothetical protein
MENYQPTVPLIKPKSTYKMHPLVRLIVISVGFMTDAYDLFVIGIVMVILREIYGEDTQAESILATAVLVCSWRYCRCNSTASNALSGWRHTGPTLFRIDG